ncbi:MAG: 3-dehydroquinate synthase, partial [Oscillospiraceae bacterium]
KTLATCEKIFDFLTENMITRSDIVIALGGGVVGDTAGFVSASYLRGIEFIQIPTTFLASIDSSVGGKTGVNTALGKNLVGAFWQPSLVVIDTNTFDTLPKNIFADGVAEAIKYGVIKNKQLFEIIKSGKIQENLETVIKECILIKKQLVEEDERDTGERMLLNFGHTIGHAIEKHSNHQVSHGSGVAIGMVLMTALSENMGITNNGTKNEIESVCKLYNLPTSYVGEEKQLVDIIKNDKKRKGNTITIVLAKEVGTSILYKIDITDFENRFVK